MSAATQSVKQLAHEAIDNMADGATWNDIIETLSLNKAVEEGIAEANNGDFASPDEVQAAFKTWGVAIEA